MHSLVTIEEFEKSYQAQLAVLALEQAGIDCYLQNETLVAMDWFMSNAVGGIKLQVSIADAEQAQNILREIRDVQIEREAENKDRWVAFPCQRCKKPVAFPGPSLGRVETCPECGKYVDVPLQSDITLAEDLREQAIQHAKEGANLFSGSFSKRMYLLMEIFLVLCIAYFLCLFVF